MSRPKESSSSAGRVLVVDDDGMVRGVFAAMLRLSGHVVLTASSGGEALSILRQIGVDVAVLDLVMPGMPGSEVCAEIRTHWPEVAVLVVSGSVTETDRKQLQGLGAVDVLRKPLSKQDLEEGVARAFEWRRARHATTTMLTPASTKRG